MGRPETLTIQVNKLEKFVTNIKKTVGDNAEISLEVLLMNTFPLLWNNMRDALNEEHMKGYLEGLEAGRKNE